MASQRSSSKSSGRKMVKLSSSPSPSTPSSADPSTRFCQLPQRSSYLSPELRVQYEQVFTKGIPQNPHFNPLSYFSEKTKDGVMLGLDLAFLLFVKELQNSADPSTFLADQQETHTKQLAEFETMGYDVSKLRERLIILQRRAAQHKVLKDEISGLEKETKEAETKAKSQELLVKALEEEVKKARDLLGLQKSNIEKINMKKRKRMEDATENVKEFKKSANSPF